MPLVKARTVTGKVYQVEISEDAVIRDLMVELEKSHGLQASSIKVIFGARILAEDTQISSIPLKPTSYFIIHTTERKPPVKQEPAPANPPPAQLGNAGPSHVVSRPAPAPAPVPAPAPAPAPAPVPANRPAPSGPADPPNFDELVGNMVELGLPRDQSIRALRSNHYNIEAAVTAIFNGEVNDAEPAPQRPGGGSSARFGEFASAYESLSESERQAVDRLCSRADPETALQIYMACDKNEQVAAGCL